MQEIYIDIHPSTFDDLLKNYIAGGVTSLGIIDPGQTHSGITGIHAFQDGGIFCLSLIPSMKGKQSIRQQHS